MRINVTRSSLPTFEEYMQEIRPLWDSHWLTNNGEKEVALQQAMEETFQVPHVRLFVNGHMALEALLAALHLQGEVITTPFTFASTTHAIVRKGLTPVFGDVREEDCTLDPDGLEDLITENTCAILPVHVYGRLCDVEKIQQIADRHHLPVIYDAAHAFGVRKNGVPAAAFGTASMFSFHATKVFHTIEGGCVATADSALADALSLERNYGITGPEDVISVGGNAKMNEFQAAMGLCNLRHVADDIAARGQVCQWYTEQLAPQKRLRLVPLQDGVESNYAYFPVIFESKALRDSVCAALAREGVYARKYFYPLITDFACYQGQPGFDSSRTPVARRLADGVVTLPLYPDLPKEEVLLICRVIREVLHG